MEEYMATVTNITGLSGGNQILGTFPEMIDSKIIFKGKNNILYCEPGVTLTESRLVYLADNSVIYLGTNRFVCKLDVAVGNDIVFHFGKDNYTNSAMNVYLSEQRHCFIGDLCLFAPGVVIRNADPHLIYDCDTKMRINPTKSIYIGDCVWVGQDAMLLKGTQIDSGSIVGARSVVTGSKIGHNTVWAGSPAKQVKKGIFWNPSVVHDWKEDMTKASQNYADYVKLFPNDFEINGRILTYNESEVIDFDQIDRQFNTLKTSQEKCDYLIQLNNAKTKNRFVHNLPEC